MAERNALRCILPPGLLDRLARSDEEAVRRSALDALRLDSRFRIARAESASRTGGRTTAPVTFARIGGSPHRTIYDQEHGTSQTLGRGRARRGPAGHGRRRGAPRPTTAWAHTYDYFWATFQRDSIDGQG